MRVSCSKYARWITVRRRARRDKQPPSQHVLSGLALTLFVSVRTLALVAVILHYGSQWARTLRAEGVLRVVNQCKQALLRVRADEYV